MLRLSPCRIGIEPAGDIGSNIALASLNLIHRPYVMCLPSTSNMFQVYLTVSAVMFDHLQLDREWITRVWKQIHRFTCQNFHSLAAFKKCCNLSVWTQNLTIRKQEDKMATGFQTVWLFLYLQSWRHLPFNLWRQTIEWNAVRVYHGPQTSCCILFIIAASRDGWAWVFRH